MYLKEIIEKQSKQLDSAIGILDKQSELIDRLILIIEHSGQG